jgi:PAS domain S-box-containing protein
MTRKSPRALRQGKPKTARSLPGLSLRDQELSYRRLFEAAQDGILILDSKTGAIIDVNPYLLNMLGYSRQEFLGKKLWEMGAFKDIRASKDAFAALQADKYMCYEDLPLKAKDGHLVQVEFVSNVYLARRQSPLPGQDAGSQPGVIFDFGKEDAPAAPTHR